MNLLTLLLGTMLTGNSVSSLAKKTGLSTTIMKKLLTMALPILINYLTKNASSTSGAQSLLGALLQHKSTKSMAEQIDEVDEIDGQKIIGHILGDDQDKVVNELSRSAGVDSAAVATTLAAMAPALLSALSGMTSASTTATQQAAAATTSASASNAIGLNDLFSMFAGSALQEEKQEEATTSSAAVGQVLSLFGNQGTTTTQAAAAESQFDGSDLVNLLGALMQ